MNFQTFGRSLDILFDGRKNYIVEALYLDRRDTIEQLMLGFRAPFGCRDGPRGEKTRRVSRKDQDGEGAQEAPASPTQKQVQMSPRQKQALRQHLKVLKVQRELGEYQDKSPVECVRQPQRTFVHTTKAV